MFTCVDNKTRLRSNIFFRMNTPAHVLFDIPQVNNDYFLNVC